MPEYIQESKRHAVALMAIIAYVAVMVSCEVGKKPEVEKSVPAVGYEALQKCRPPATNLEGFKSEIDQLIQRYHRDIEDGRVDLFKDDTLSIINTVVYGRDCLGLTLREMGVKEDFWRTFAVPLDEIPQRERP